MNVRVDDLEVLGTLRPLDISAYLRSRGWSEVDPSSDDPLSAWETTIGGATFECSPRDIKVARLRPPRALRARDARRGRAALAAGDHSRCHRGLRGRRAATGDERLDLGRHDRAARRARHRRCGARPDALGGMLGGPPAEGLPCAQAGRGDEVPGGPAPWSERARQLRVHGARPWALPLAPSQLAFPHPEGVEAAPEPYERQVTRTLGVALDKLSHAAGRGAATGALDAFEDAVPLGVSADLCEALDLVRECSHVSSFELSIAWAPSRPVPPKTPSRTTFTPDVLDVIHEAGRMLRERTPIEDFELEGPVIHLSRPDAALQGTAVVFGRVNGQPRQISVELWNSDWNTASDALSGHRVFRCSGELTQRGKLFVLTNPPDEPAQRDRRPPGVSDAAGLSPASRSSPGMTARAEPSAMSPPGPSAMVGSLRCPRPGCASPPPVTQPRTPAPRR